MELDSISPGSEYAQIQVGSYSNDVYLTNNNRQHNCGHFEFKFVPHKAHIKAKLTSSLTLK